MDVGRCVTRQRHTLQLARGDGEAGGGRGSAICGPPGAAKQRKLPRTVLTPHVVGDGQQALVLALPQLVKARVVLAALQHLEQLVADLQRTMSGGPAALVPGRAAAGPQQGATAHAVANHSCPGHSP